MAPNNENGQENKESGSKKTVLIVIAVLLLANIVLLWQFFNKKSENQTKTIHTGTSFLVKICRDILISMQRM